MQFPRNYEFSVHFWYVSIHLDVTKAAIKKNWVFPFGCSCITLHNCFCCCFLFLFLCEVILDGLAKVFLCHVSVVFVDMCDPYQA